MVFDPVRGVTVLFGGQTSVTNEEADTWEWDGVSWSQRAPATSPPARYGHRMVWDAARQRVVLFGGRAIFQPLDDSTWEWNGTDWTELVATAASPAGRVSYGLAYDAAGARTVLFGGSVGGAPWSWSADTWVFGDLTSASGEAFGTPCPAGGYAPSLTGYGRPALANASFALDLHGAEPGSACAFGLAASSAPVLFGGCVFQLQQPVLVSPAQVGAAGFASLPLFIPESGSLTGLVLYAQAFGVRPATPRLEVWMTRGLALTLGE
jgi:hypothetical protein